MSQNYHNDSMNSTHIKMQSTQTDMQKAKLLKIDTANKVLALFTDKTSISIDKNYIIVNWSNSQKSYSKRWMCRGQDFYPVWHRHWGHGGTATIALSQLVRWIQDKPILPLTTWEYWGTPKYRLFRDKAADIIKLLTDAKYPQNALCVLCNQQLKSMDWWSLGGVSGPCCNMTSGCMQKRIYA